MIDDRSELLAQIATLYYHYDKSQQEIANQFDLSRSNVSRLLKEARERGIVEIFIHHPLRRMVRLEQQLVARFDLHEAGVVQADPHNAAITLARAAELAARMLDAALEHAHVLGISWGTAVHATANAFVPHRRHDVEVVQIMGGVGPVDPAIDGPALAQQLASRMTNRCRYLHAPLIVDTPDTAQSLLVQRNIADTLALARRADVALVGVGALDANMSSLLRAGYLSRAEFDAIHAQGVVGDVCARHFDRDGNIAAPELDARTISVTRDDLSAIPTVIGIACTPAKAEALRGALRGRYINVLVTDSEAAELILGDA